jgi:hypothetical protein
MTRQEPAPTLKLAPRPGLPDTPCRWHCTGAPDGLETRLSCVSSAPQNPHKSGSAAWFPTKSPRTKRHSPAHGGTGANMTLLALTSLYAGSAGLAILKLPVVRTSTDLLKSGRSAVRPCPLTTSTSTGIPAPEWGFRCSVDRSAQFYQECRGVPRSAVLSVGFLWGGSRTRTCGIFVGLAGAPGG